MHDPELISAIQHRGYHCQYEQPHSRYVCAEKRVDGALTGISFSVWCLASRWLIGLWSGVDYLVPSDRSVTEIALDILSGTCLPSGQVPTLLPGELLSKHGITACSVVHACSWNESVHIEEAEALALPLPFDQAELVTKVSPWADECKEHNSVVRFVFGSAAAECEFQNDGSVQGPLQPIILEGYYSNSGDQARLLRMLGEALEVCIYDVAGSRIPLD